MDAKVIAFVSDMHCGSTVALAPPTIDLDDGGHYQSSPSQLWLWQCWEDYWERVAAVRKAEKADLILVFNGDMTDGDHHGTTQILSGNPTAQAAVVDACMAVPLALKPDKLFFVRGTEAHVGKSGAFEERIARGLQKDDRPVIGDPATRTASWWHLRMEAGGVRFDVAHHGRTGQREHTRQNAANLYAHDILLAHVKDGETAPHIAIRSHFHKWMDSWDAAKVLRLIGLPAWQLATAYVHRIAPDSLADIGGLIVTVKDGEYEAEKVSFKPGRPAWMVA